MKGLSDKEIDDLIEKYPEIIFQYDSFLSDDVEKLTNGIITKIRCKINYVTFRYPF